MTAFALSASPRKICRTSEGDVIVEERALHLTAGPVPEPASPEIDVLVEEEEEEDTGTSLDDPWKVILYNDDVHTFEEVIAQLVKATGCSKKKAERHAWTVHTRGKDAVYEGSFEDCFRVQGILREIQLITEIEG